MAKQPTAATNTAPADPTPPAALAQPAPPVDAQADAPAPDAAQDAQPVPEAEPAPESDLVTGGDGVTRDPPVEAHADAINDEAARTHVRMRHPDGGTSDRYAADGDCILVPAAEAAELFSHGFEVVAD